MPNAAALKKKKKRKKETGETKSKKLKYEEHALSEIERVKDMFVDEGS